MTLDVALQILELAISLVRGQSSGAVQSDAALAQTLTDIARVATQASEIHAGRPIDPALIKPEAAI